MAQNSEDVKHLNGGDKEKDSDQIPILPGSQLILDDGSIYTEVTIFSNELEMEETKMSPVIEISSDEECESNNNLLERACQNNQYDMIDLSSDTSSDEIPGWISKPKKRAAVVQNQVSKDSDYVFLGRSKPVSDSSEKSVHDSVTQSSDMSASSSFYYESSDSVLRPPLSKAILELIAGSPVWPQSANFLGGNSKSISTSESDEKVHDQNSQDSDCTVLGMYEPDLKPHHSEKSLLDLLSDLPKSSYFLGRMPKSMSQP